MNIKTKLSIGDSMYAICKSEEIRKIPCVSCNETGKIKLASGKIFTCPECYGEKYFKQRTPKQWNVMNDSFMYGQSVESIQIKITEGTRKYNPDIDITYTPKGFRDSFHEEDVFSSREKAQAECDRRNKALKE